MAMHDFPIPTFASVAHARIRDRYLRGLAPVGRMAAADAAELDRLCTLIQRGGGHLVERPVAVGTEVTVIWPSGRSGTGGYNCSGPWARLDALRVALRRAEE